MNECLFAILIRLVVHFIAINHIIHPWVNKNDLEYHFELLLLLFTSNNIVRQSKLFHVTFNQTLQ